MKKIIFVLICILGVCTAINAQNVVQKNNTFEQVSKRQKKFAGAIKTKYIYKDSTGKEYPIMISKNGKVFVIKTKKNGKQYPYYLKDLQDKIYNEYANRISK